MVCLNSKFFHTSVLGCFQLTFPLKLIKDSLRAAIRFSNHLVASSVLFLFFFKLHTPNKIHIPLIIPVLNLFKIIKYSTHNNFNHLHTLALTYNVITHVCTYMLKQVKTHYK